MFIGDAYMYRDSTQKNQLSILNNRRENHIFPTHRHFKLWIGFAFKICEVCI